MKVKKINREVTFNTCWYNFLFFIFPVLEIKMLKKKKKSNLGFQNFVKWKLFFQKFKMGR